MERNEGVTSAEVLGYLQENAAEQDAAPETTDQIFDLAYHFHAGGDSRAFAYQWMVGE